MFMRKSIFYLLIIILTYDTWSYVPIQIPTRINEIQKKYLNADLYTSDTTKPKPVILVQTPYNKNLYRISNGSGISGAQMPYDTVNYNYVVMDWRGFYSNKAQDSTGYNRGLDGYDAVEWIATQKWSNGKIGTWGGSALGMIQFQTAAQNPPHLVCSAPFIKDFLNKYEDYYYGGVLRKEHTESLEKFGFITVNLVTSHPDEDKIWQYAETISQLAPKIKVPMLMATGWFDHFPGDVIRAFNDIRTMSDISVRSTHKLIIGPWSHMSIGQADQGDLSFPESVGLIPQIANQFFDHYLLDEGNNYENNATVNYFEMGTNQWVSTGDWNSIQRKSDTLYLNKDRKLLTTPPPPIMSPIGEKPDTILYNPKDPSPTVGGSRFNPFDKTLKVGPLDISNTVENRKDVLVYSTNELDKPMQINGSVNIVLMTSSDKTDTDYGVRLTDVYPDDKSIILTQGITRLRFREGTSTEKLGKPGEKYRIEIKLEPLAHVFLQGHKFRIDITSSNYPMFALNLNDGGPMYSSGDTMSAVNLVHHSAEDLSYIVIPSMKSFASVDDQNSNADFHIFPNPANDRIYIDLSYDLISKYMISVFDVIGRKVIEAKSNEIEISNLNSGIYYLKCGTIIKKFVKM